ncbi:HAD family hydrolase [Shewanella psychropiezotolerans]|uniref:phosphoglycolate phosphatase n=1 Tax=Shewanella psychropiezotolerans TaxID=2593655 RepID=A0ABX5X0B8_9GAMM|nr:MULTISPECIES: HAD hydrolase-like protein [Shewanella]MPY21591.1 HAD family hydrolase [Shewanella sp. YLB-07]QDO84804.1 HAD family hydrolase [Shewanella psychropiezotolerans]
MEAHIVWDWNGTLLDDVHVSLEATNRALRKVNVPSLSVKEYKENYCVPVHDFYQKILSRTPTEYEWKVIGQEFNTYYKPVILTASLSNGAKEIIQRRESQSVCSLMEHHLLEEMLSTFKIDHFFNLVQGRMVALSREGKKNHLEQHIQSLSSKHHLSKDQIVLVGDANDDAEAARSLGIASILYSGGTHSYDRLKNVGVPVANTLQKAIEYADNMVNR